VVIDSLSSVIYWAHTAVLVHLVNDPVTYVRSFPTRAATRRSSRRRPRQARGSRYSRDVRSRVTSLLLSVPRRFTLSQDFPNGLPCDLQMPANLPDRPAVDPMLLADELDIDQLEHCSFPLPPARLASAYREPISRWSTIRRALTHYWSTFRLAITPM